MVIFENFKKELKKNVTITDANVQSRISDNRNVLLAAFSLHLSFWKFVQKCVDILKLKSIMIHSYKINETNKKLKRTC